MSTANLTKPRKVTTGDTIKVAGRTFTVLFGDLTRPLSGNEFLGLLENISELGIQCPPVVDEDDGIIDGIHRLLVAEELNLEEDEVPLDVRRGYSHEEKHALARDLNVHRRHLDLERLKELRKLRIERVAARYAAGETQEQIAEGEGLTRDQVRTDLKQVQRERGLGGTQTPPPRRPKGGRPRKASQPSPPPAREEERGEEREEETPPLIDLGATKRLALDLYAQLTGVLTTLGVLSKADWVGRADWNRIGSKIEALPD